MPMLRPSSLVPRSWATLLVLAAALLATPLAAADLPGPDDIAVPAPTTVPAPAPSGDAAGDAAADAALAAERAAVQAFGAKNPACLAWSDGCVTCQKGDDGKTVCANPGPACLPKATACTRVRDVPADPTPKDSTPKDSAPKDPATKDPAPKDRLDDAGPAAPSAPPPAPPSRQP